MLTEQQAEYIKSQLLDQITTFPVDQQDSIRAKILSMSCEEVELFIKENKLNNLDEKSEDSQCIFCKISSKKISSIILTEDKENLVVLELNPLSKGHSIVIPKKHLDIINIPSTSFTLAKKVAKKIQNKYKPLEIKISTYKIMDHGLIEILPIYGNEKDRKKASEEELKEIQKEIRLIENNLPKIKKKSIEDKKIINLPKLNPRVP
jgi:histidine triad (HIT) family protein